jgi:hypothetical protein
MSSHTKSGEASVGLLRLSAVLLGVTVTVSLVASAPVAAINYPPLAICVDQHVYEDYPGAGYATDVSIDGGSFDFDNPYRVYQSPPPESQFSIGVSVARLTIVSWSGPPAYSRWYDSCTADIVVEAHDQVLINVQPDDRENVIPASDRATVPVVMYGNANFDPTTDVVVSSVRFGEDETVRNGGGVTPVKSEVIDYGDNGVKDLLLFFPVEGTGFEPGDTTARVHGQQTSGTPMFWGDDGVSVAS